VLAASPALQKRGIQLRIAEAADLSFLRELYGVLRAAELAPIPWPEPMKQTFLDDQFALQHQHFVLYHASADFLVIEHHGQPVGRLYVARQPEQDFHIVDIALLPALRQSGIGTQLIAQLQQEAASAHRAVTLHVDSHNPAARRLYERLGFVQIDEEGPYQRMHWQAPVIS
jgi:predicted GNAT family acetyltransferase